MNKHENQDLLQRATYTVWLEPPGVFEVVTLG